MISFRHADLIPSIQDSLAPTIDVDFTITFPTQNNGNEHAMREGRYYGVVEMHIDLPSGEIKNNNSIIDRVEKALGGDYPYQWGDVHSIAGETFDDFARRVRDLFKELLAPISEVPPSHTMRSTGQYQWIIHTKIKPIKK